MKTLSTIIIFCFPLLIGFQATAQIHKKGGAEYLGPDWYRTVENFNNSPLPVVPIDYVPYALRRVEKAEQLPSPDVFRTNETSRFSLADEKRRDSMQLKNKLQKQKLAIKNNNQ